MCLEISGPRPYFWQWDTGQKLLVRNPSCNEIHYSNGVESEALVVKVKDDNGVRYANVPNILLCSGVNLTAYIFSQNGSQSETCNKYTFMVRRRNRPSSYVYTETEALNYSNLAARIDEIEMNGITSERIAAAVEEYLEANPPTGSGADGADGISATHSWEGTVLTITSASGISSADLQGPAGQNGEDGKTPVKGEDYFTDTEISEIASQAAEMVAIDQVDPAKVVFPDGATTTYAIGKVKLTNGMGTLVEPGGTLVDFFNNFVDEKNPSTTQPSVSLILSQAKAYEAGTNVTPSYSATLNAGSYTYGPATGITAKSWEVTDTAGHTATTSSGSFAQFQVTDGINYKVTAKATYDAGTAPVTNVGNPYTSGQIAAGSKSATSGAVTSYRNTFYGTLTTKSDVDSDVIRDLASKSGKALSNGSSFTVAIPVGALRVVIAYPATLQDITSIKDVNGMNAEISSGFASATVDVEGANNYTAISYKVYTLDYAEANQTANKYTVTI